MEGNIYKLKDYVYSNKYNSKKFYIISDVSYFTDSYTLVELSLEDDTQNFFEISNIELKQMFDLEFDAFLNNWKFMFSTLSYIGTYSKDVLPWKQMINYKGGCFHKWVRYVGFIEEYEYCEKCNEKRA